VIALLVIVAVSAISICALLAAVVERWTKQHGNRLYATVTDVRRAIPTGMRHLFGGKDGTYPCDYLLTLSYTNQKGETVTAKPTVPSRIKIRDGRRFLHFGAGDKVEVSVNGRFPHSVVFREASIAEKQGTLFPIVLWSFCTVVSLAIFIYLLVTG